MLVHMPQRPAHALQLVVALWCAILELVSVCLCVGWSVYTVRTCVCV